jgi:hypothetical protein
MGSLLLRDTSGNQCISYSEFRDVLEEDRYAQFFLPLKKLLERLTPSPDDCRWKRLETFDVSLTTVEAVCRKVLTPQRA